jgi:precorrin-6A/cobalt-precorrin-6A reductase
MPLKRILILGGTREARELANHLVDAGCDVTTSLAGVTDSPVLPKGKIRQGGFGGMDGLATFLVVEHFDHVVDATHPFAAQISSNAVAACKTSRTSLLRMEREAWVPETGDKWISASNFADALNHLPSAAKVMLTLGRKEVGAFFARADLGGVARMIEAPDVEVPPNFKLILKRPPFSVADELALMKDHDIQFLLCKNSGGPRAEKLDAARMLHIPVVVVERPVKPEALTVHSLADALGLLLGRAQSSG